MKILHKSASYFICINCNKNRKIVDIHELSEIKKLSEKIVKAIAVSLKNKLLRLNNTDFLIFSEKLTKTVLKRNSIVISIGTAPRQNLAQRSLLPEFGVKPMIPLFAE